MDKYTFYIRTVFAAFLVVSIIPLVSYSAEQKSVLLTIKYNKSANSIEVLSEKLLEHPAPKTRSKHLKKGKFVLEYESESGETIGFRPVTVSNEIRGEWPKDSSGELTGVKFEQNESVFQAVVPYSETLSQVKLLKPRKGAKKPKENRSKSQTAHVVYGYDKDDYEVLGISPVDTRKIKSEKNK